MILNEISEFIIVDDLNNEFSNVRKKKLMVFWRET